MTRGDYLVRGFRIEGESQCALQLCHHVSLSGGSADTGTFMGSNPAARHMMPDEMDSAGCFLLIVLASVRNQGSVTMQTRRRQSLRKLNE
jgi:hypothetical protein